MAKTKKGFEVRNRPDWLYNSLPYAYVAIGLIVMAVFGMRNVVGAFSGVMFIATGAVVFAMRWTYRRAMANLQAELAIREQRKEENELSLLRISWNKGYESGNPVIDEQHHRLFDLGNALLNAMLVRKQSAAISIFLTSLLEHIQDHLHTEEEVLAELKHPITIEHKAAHEHLLGHAKALVNQHRRGKLDYGGISEFITYDLIAQHIVTEDKQYFVAHPEPATSTTPT